MVVGNQNNSAAINTQIGTLVNNLWDTCSDILKLQEYVVAQGLTGLEGIGFDAPDAETATSAVNYLNTMAEIFFGTVAQTPAFNFSSELAPYTGGGDG
jgi:hypothetical protein